jgi:hypothetical protein
MESDRVNESITMVTCEYHNLLWMHSTVSLNPINDIICQQLERSHLYLMEITWLQQGTKYSMVFFIIRKKCIVGMSILKIHLRNYSD